MQNASIDIDLSPLGASESVLSAWKASGSAGLARVLSSRRDRWLLAGLIPEGCQLAPEQAGARSLGFPLALAVASGKLIDSGGLPVTGDWVLLREASAPGSLAVIEALLPRASLFSRKAAGPESREQAIAANIDQALCVMAADANFNLRRLERYLSLAWDSRARPVVVISKADLALDRASLEQDLDGVSFGLPRFFCSAKTGEGMAELSAALSRGSTSVLLGSSGCGKSSLLNALAGETLMDTRELSSLVGKGRHTTTSRELFALSSGALVIDTPGMRELGMNCAVESVDAAFPEIDELARSCRFADCGHGAEPGCAVRAAIEAGKLTEDRLMSWRKLQREAAFEHSREDALRAKEAFFKAIAKGTRSQAGHSYKETKHGKIT